MSSTRRVLRLARTELVLFWRNRVAALTALLLPAATVAFFSGIDRAESSLSANAFNLTGVIGSLLLFVVYYNLVTAYVARREELVLKRLRTGECRDAEILLATAVPAVGLTLAQAALAVLVGGFLLGLPAPVNPVLLLVGLLGGAALFILLAAVSTAFTRTVEMAQVSTLPVLMVCLLGSGAFVPVEAFGESVARSARLVPLTPVMELVRLGWLGTTGAAEPVGFGDALVAAAAPFAILVGWIAVGWYGLRRWFRWEPRR